MQVIGMGSIRTGPYAGGECTAGGLPHSREEPLLDAILGPFDADRQAASLPRQDKGEDIERPTCRMLAQRPSCRPVATPAFLTASNPQANQIPAEIAFRQRLDAAGEKFSRPCRHLATQGDRWLEDDRHRPHLERLDQDGALDAAGGILGFGGVGISCTHTRAIKRAQLRQAGGAIVRIRQLRWARASGERRGVGGLRRLLRAQINRSRRRQGLDPCLALAVVFHAMNVRGMDFRAMNATCPDRDGQDAQGEPANASRP
nr:hypothetical protein [Bosea psychrotolerans]